MMATNQSPRQNEDRRRSTRSQTLRLAASLSIVFVSIAAFLTAYLVIVQPSYAPVINVMSRSLKNLFRKQTLEMINPVIVVNISTEFPIKEGRLPDFLQPSDYHIKLDIDLTKDTYKGLVSINLECLSPTNSIVYHGVDLIFKQLNVKRINKKAEEIKIRRTLYHPETEIYYTELVDELQQGDKIELTIDYKAPFSKQLAGLYKSHYKGEDGKKRLVATSHMEPTDARRAFPCLDEPEFKSRFHITINHDKSYTALSNMPRKDERRNGNQIEDRFLPTEPMSTYLVAFAVTDFVFKEAKTSSGKPVRCYAPPHDSERIQYAADAGAKIISFYETFFGVPYPLPKLDLLAVPDFLAGAMEDWGLISFRNAYLIYDKERVPLEAKKQITMVIAHELAHQWFGNLVTMKWWNDIWLNEGFANFVEMLGTNKIDDTFCALDLQIPQGWQSAITLDSLKNSHPISQDVQKPSEIDELFDAISYNKGAAVLRMLQTFMKKKNFINGVKDYIHKHSFSNAETDDLWTSLSQSSNHLEIKKIMDTWTKQRGFPVLQIKRASPTSFTVYQRSFLKTIKSNATDSLEQEDVNALWYVPFTYVTDLEPKKVQTVWLNHVKEITVQTKNGFNWVKGNMVSNGFYVVNYGEEIWQQLILQMTTNHEVFDVTDRANLIHDAFKLACENVISPIIPLELSKYLKKEKDYLPWSMARAKYDCLSLLLKDKKMKTLYKKYFWGLQSHLVDISLLEPAKYNAGKLSLMETFQRYEAFNFALKFGFKQDFTRELRKMFKKMKLGMRIPDLSAELRSLVMIYGCDHSSDSDFDYLHTMYLDSQFDADRKIIMRAFSLFFKDPKKLNKVLKMSLDDSKVRAQDTLPLQVNIVKMGGRHAVWEFMKENWKSYKERYGNGYQLGGFVSEVIGGFTTNNDLAKAKEFLKKHPISHENSRTEKQAIEKIMNNLKRQDSATSAVATAAKATAEWIEREMKPKSKAIKIEPLAGHTL